MGTKEGFTICEKHVLRKLNDPMETDLTPPNAEDLKTCSRISDVFECQLVKQARLTYNKQILYTMDSGFVRKNQENYNLIEKEIEKLMEEIQDLERELTLIGTCPVTNCQYHSKSNYSKTIKKINDSSKQQKIEFAKILTATASDANLTPNPSKKKNRQDGFITSAKVVKKHKVLQNYSFGAAAPVNTTNKL
ncbi:hypothetical protein TNCV_1443041 [Trichonephila clavipes]|nr:hypothetical protein TNCV_1443041 [Trichonephila clavipes]